MKKLGKFVTHCFLAVTLGVGTASIVIIVRLIIEYYWGK